MQYFKIYVCICIISKNSKYILKGNSCIWGLSTRKLKGILTDKHFFLKTL